MVPVMVPTIGTTALAVPLAVLVQSITPFTGAEITGCERAALSEAFTLRVSMSNLMVSFCRCRPSLVVIILPMMMKI